MFNDAIGLVRELINSDDFDDMLEKLIVQWRDESQHSTVSDMTIIKFLGVVNTHKMAVDIKRDFLNGSTNGKKLKAANACGCARSWKSSYIP